ncbi:unnamed protein product [Staurois parvus]|uniref:Uncharacterized protein n=1 Tax=Staurois parvus TaxID=386267 RepID=A0ABN9ALE3_9NEOB|nr:unnamed protein product [Staurois parvus]
MAGTGSSGTGSSGSTAGIGVTSMTAGTGSSGIGSSSSTAGWVTRHDSGQPGHQALDCLARAGHRVTMVWQWALGHFRRDRIIRLVHQMGA